MSQLRQQPLMIHIESMKNMSRSIHSDAIASRIASETANDLFVRVGDKIMSVYKAVAKDKTSEYPDYSMPSASQNGNLNNSNILNSLTSLHADLISMRETFKEKGFKIVDYKGETNTVSNATKSVLTKAINDLEELMDLYK